MNDDAVIKLAQLEGKIESVAEIVSRIERVVDRALQRFEASDGAVRELVVQQQHTQERINDLRRATDACSESHRAAADVLGAQIRAVSESHAALENKSAGALRVVLWFCGAFSAVALSVGAWAFNQISKNTELNGLQQQRIERLEKELADTRADVREFIRPQK